jgi:glycosyltransferase involved in cell wall biosynthesis
MTISVVLPCHNAGPWIEEALESVRAQTRRPLEVIVVDDASGDDSIERARRFPEVRVLVAPRNAGAGAARNTGLAAASGELIAWLDADDIWEPNHLETVAALLEHHPAAALAFSLNRAFGVRDNVWGKALPAGRPVDAFWESWRQTIAQMSTIVMRREAAAGIGGFEPTIRWVEDFEFLLRLARRHPFVCTHEITVRYRKHAASTSRHLVLCRMQEYEVRSRFLTAARATEPAPFVERLEEECRQCWQLRLREAWGRRSLPMLRFYLGLEVLVPGGTATGKAWRRKARLAPLWGIWDRLRRRSAPPPPAGG